jgi:CheY-like chemotaxis protein
MTERRRPILIVEDDVDLVACLRELLEEDGREVLHAVDGDTALAACARDPALVLVDLHLPGQLRGRALVAAMRERLSPAVRILLLTADRDVPRWAAALGVDGFLEKPFEIDALLDIIHQHAI